MIYIWHLYTKLCIYDVTININLLNFTVAFYKWHTTLLFDQISQHYFKKKNFFNKKWKAKNIPMMSSCYYDNVLYTWGQWSKAKQTLESESKTKKIPKQNDTWTIEHSSVLRLLSLIKLLNKMLQNWPYFWKKITKKKLMGCRIPKIWQILKHFTRFVKHISILLLQSEPPYLLCFKNCFPSSSKNEKYAEKQKVSTH